MNALSEIPAGYIEGFFNIDRPEYINYAILGFTIGHEIIHGFDSSGHKFNGDGMYVDWWQNSTKNSFEKKYRCVVDQYNNLTDPISGLTANGSITLNENIADNGGLMISYRVYRKYLNENGLLLTLPYLNMSLEQLFWVLTAQIWCTKCDKGVSASLINESSK